MTPSHRHVHVFAAHDIRSFHGVAIYIGAGVVIGAKSRALEGDSRKQTARTRVAKDFGAHPGVGIRRGVAAFWSTGDRSVGAKFDFAAENRIHAAAVHD